VIAKFTELFGVTATGAITAGARQGASVADTNAVKIVAKLAQESSATKR